MRCFAMAMSIALAAATMLSACATPGAATVLDEPVTSGTSHEFPASYDVVKDAALQGVRGLNVSVEGYDETEERFQIRFSKLFGGVAWGDMGVVNVVRVDHANTLVVVNSELSDMQWARARERQFADQVFAAIAEGLSRARR